MEQLDIPTIIGRSLTEQHNASPEEIRETMLFLTILGRNKHTVVDQYGNTVFFTTPIKENKKGYRVAAVKMYTLDQAVDLVRQVYAYLKKLKQRKISVLKFSTDDVRLTPLFRAIDREYPVEIRKAKKTGRLYGTINIQEPK